MPDTFDIRNKVLEIAEPVCIGAGYELVDLSYQREQNGWVVRIYIDIPRDGESVSFADCEGVSRELSAVFDVEDVIPNAYNLEVSSPGVERPLRTAAHFGRFVGSVAKVSLRHGIDGRRNFKGALTGFDADQNQILIQVDGTDYKLPLADLQTARLVPDWDALLRGKGKEGGTAGRKEGLSN